MRDESVNRLEGDAKFHGAQADRTQEQLGTVMEERRLERMWGFHSRC